jgi:hypothetical protein
MKNIIITLLIVCCFSVVNAQSKKEIIQELTIENTNLKQEISVLNNKIQVLESENITLNKDIAALKKELYVDKVQTPLEYGKTLFDLFVSQRLAKYPEIQFQSKDTIYLIGKNVNTIKEAINKIQKNSLEFYLEGINNGIDWSKVEYERFEYIIEKPNRDISTNYLRGKFYFNYLGKKYRFRNDASILENGKWRGYIFNDLVNETEKLEIEKKEKQERLNEPYIPNGIKFGNVNYTYLTDEVNSKTMYDLKIPIENNTDYAIDWIKIQFRIYENGELKLSKNIIVSEYTGFDSKLEPGEKEIIELKEIGEVFIKSGVKNGNWYSDVKLLEVKPKQFED